MIQVTYNEVGDEMILRAEGHAGYAEKGKDIVCAAVSVLMQTLACSVDADNTGNTFELSDGKNGNRLTVQAPMSVLNRDKFDLVVEGLIRLAENYPENVQFKKLCTKSVNVMDLQMFAEGGDGSGAGETSQSAGADSSPSRGALGRTENSTLDEQGSTDTKAEGSGSENGEGEAGEEAKKPSPAERRKAFGQMMSGEYKDLADEMMQNAVQIAAQNLEASPEMRGLLEAIAEKYGTDATDLTALTDAIRNGVVKDDAYFEKIAMEKGISVKTAREMDKLETQNRRLTAQQQAAQQMQKAAAERARIAQIQARWDAEAEALKAKYPEFDREEVLANPEVEKMMRAGCSMEAAYRAAYFDRLMARQTAATAQQTEQGVLNRVQQRASRPAENGTRPGGAVQTHLDVEHMSRKDREALEKRVLRGEIITL
ncbi:ribosomal-processing cysteine protease Prp [Faecalibacterium hattorii]|uniref:ribosomal-processing cysteine protease Prp n=1 Tax=Faecalibacterium hattorii TaxID=2935520 RepID=UPI003AADE719